MTIRSKKRLQEIIIGILWPEKAGQSLTQINMWLSLCGEREMMCSERDMKTLEWTAWFLGFVYANIGNRELRDIFLYGFKCNWFYSDLTNEDYCGVLKDFCCDILLSDHALFKDIFGCILKRDVVNEHTKSLFSIAYGTGVFPDVDDVFSLKRKYA